MKRTEVVPPGLAWLTVFIPALSYFLVTRFSSLHNGGASLGTAFQSTRVDSIRLKDVFYLEKNSIELQQPLVLIDDSFQDVVASTWRHDAELGRGYLLVSQAHSQGRIWRWERGGGPIPIGRTLAMDPSGCRSKQDCGGRNGSGGLAVDFLGQEDYRQGSLVVAEWGEGRIVKLEEESGARTPLVINVPDACKHASAKPRRVERVGHMLYTPFGDLLFMEDSSCSTVMRLNQAVHVPPLESAMTSRMAHKWNSTHHDHVIDVLYKEADLGSMSLDSTGLGLYVTVKRDEDSVLLVHLSLLEDDDDDDEDEEDVSSTVDTKMGLLHHTAKVTFNLTEANIVEPPKAMAVDDKGNVFLAVSAGVLVLEQGKQVLGKLETPTPITSLTLGEDKYLYLTTTNALFRIRVRNGPTKPPINLVKKKSKKAI